MEITKRNDLIRCQWIEDLVSRRNEVKSLVSDAMAMLERASSLTPGTIGLSSVFSDAKWYSLAGKSHGNPLREVVIQAALARFDQEGWRELIKRSEITNLMNTVQTQRMHEQISTAPQLTEENIRATFFSFWDKREDTWEQGVVDVFMQAAKSKYKSQGTYCIGRRILLANRTNRASRSGFGDSVRTKLIDIVRICRLLENTDNVTHMDDLSFVDSIEKRISVGESVREWFGVMRFYENGNLHVYLLPKYIEGINDIIARRLGKSLAKDKC